MSAPSSRPRVALLEAGIEAMLVTLSEQGMTLVQQQARPLHLPAQAREVFDVSGAGDTVVAVLAASLGAGAGLAEAAALANAVAGIVVGRSAPRSPTRTRSCTSSTPRR